MQRTRAWLPLLILLFLFSIAGCPSPPPEDASRSPAMVRAQMERLLTYLDSSSYARSVSWEEHIVLAYRSAQGREPTALEFTVLRALRDELGLKRSNALALIMGGEGQGPTWEQCRQFADKVSSSDFRTDSSATAIAKRLAAVSPESVTKSFDDDSSDQSDLSDLSDQSDQSDSPDRSYSTYFGYLHAHSGMSDGRGTPIEAYTYARDVGGLDFFALTDHGEFMALWPWADPWERLKAAADATDEPGRFAALWGFEWSSPVFGHINVLNTEDFVHCLRPFRLRHLYDWIALHPRAFARFNHPGYADFFNVEFFHFLPYYPAIRQMVGVELFNEDLGFDYYHYSGSWSSSFSYLDIGNRNGWYLGALGGQDNHGEDWGSRNEFRTAVLAEELTREAIADAYRARRFYATEDKNLHLDFRCQGYPMGACLCRVTREFNIAASDAGGDAFQQVRLYRNGELIDTAVVSGTDITATFADLAETGHDYYYVIVTQTDDNDANGRPDEAIASPIWIAD